MRESSNLTSSLLPSFSRLTSLHDMTSFSISPGAALSSSANLTERAKKTPFRSFGWSVPELDGEALKKVSVFLPSEPTTSP